MEADFRHSNSVAFDTKKAEETQMTCWVEIQLLKQTHLLDWKNLGDEKNPLIKSTGFSLL